MATPVLETRNNFQEFLDAHLSREMLRFTTAGSVDDGKSTLMSRLLHDTRAVYDDQLASIRSSSVNRSTGPIDFSLLTDGLRAEREQGITIDVAYRYFSTARRKFIIADTPGHEQYTRNMATGASTADVAIILIDAVAFERLGSLLPQSRRHTFIASLLGIPHLVAAVNKMDLAGYSEERFAVIEEQFRAFAAKLGRTDVQVIPSALSPAIMSLIAARRCPGTKAPRCLNILRPCPWLTAAPHPRRCVSRCNWCSARTQTSAAMQARLPAERFMRAVRFSRCLHAVKPASSPSSPSTAIWIPPLPRCCRHTT